MAKKSTQKQPTRRCHCAVCTQAFPDFRDNDAHQAIGCASHIHERESLAGFGSSHDGSHIYFAPEFIGVKGEICDECLDQLLAAGLAAVISDDNFMEAPDRRQKPSDLNWSAMRLSARSQTALRQLAARGFKAPAGNIEISSTETTQTTQAN